MEENVSGVQETENLQNKNETDNNAGGNMDAVGTAPSENIITENSENLTISQNATDVEAVQEQAQEAVVSDIVYEQGALEVDTPQLSAEMLSQEESTQEAEKQEPKWYIVQVLTGQEDRVKERIDSSIEEMALKEKVFRVLVPEEETVEIKGDRRIERKRKMYPGYVFIEMLLDEDTWYKIRSTLGVARFIGGKTHPIPVTDREIQRVLKQIGIKEKEFTVEFEIGEAIRIISGSFRGYTGSVNEINAAKSKMKVMINIFGRDTSVEVDFDRIEKVV